MSSNVEVIIRTIDQSSTALGQVDAKYKAFSKELSGQAQAFSNIQKQKAAALADEAEAVGKVDAKYRAFSDNLSKQAQAYNAVQKQKSMALAESKKAQEAATRAEQEAIRTQKANRLSLTDVYSATQLAAQGLQKLKQGYDFAKEGAQIEFTAQKFDRLAKTIGTTGDALKEKLLVATKGTMSEMDAMASATDLVSLGLVKTEADTVRLSAVVSGLGMDMNQLVLALSNQTTMRFDQLGVAVVGFDEKVKALEKTGMSAQDAFTEAFLQQAEEQLLKVGNAADTSLGQFQKMEAATKDLKVEFNKFAAALIAPQLPELTEGLKQATWRVQNFTDIWDEMNRLRGDGFGGIIMGLDDFNKLQDQAEANVRATQEAIEHATKAVEIGASRWDEMNTVLATTNTQLPLTEEQIEEISDANSLFLGVLGDVQSAQEDYNTGMAKARDELYEGKIKTEEYSAKVDALAADYEEASARIVLSIIEMKLAQGGWTDAELAAYLEIGKAQGVFTQKQVDMAKGAIDMADDMVSAYGDLEGPLLHAGERAEDADVAFGGMARAAAELGEGLRKDAASGASALTSALNGIPTEINVDVNIRVHGSLPKGIMGGSSGTTLVQCFVAGTLVTLSDGTRKPIEQLQIGDEVRSYNIERREFVAGKVSKIMSRDITEYLNIDGVLVTEEHPFWHVGRGEWVKAKAIRRNDFLLRDYGGTKVVNFVFKVSEPATVYNLTVDGEHNYFAGGVLVHNKSVDDFDSGATPHASGGMFTIPHAYGNEGFMLGNGDTASGGEKLAISPKGQDFVDYDRLAAAMPRIDYRAMARAMDQVLQQRGY
jgi:hypothetical protein